MEYIFRRAAVSDAEPVRMLYDSAKGTEFCTWNDSYPTMEDIRIDLSAGTLYVLEMNGLIIGALSVVPENELDGLEFWTPAENVREIARVVISSEYSGRRLAGIMMGRIESILATDGCEAIRLLAAVANIPAVRTYRRCGFGTRGVCDMYGNTYYAMEKIIRPGTL